jgi:hypothetical protein
VFSFLPVVVNHGLMISCCFMIAVVVLANANNWKKRMIENTTDILCCVCLYAYHLFIHPLTLRYCIKLWPVEKTVDSGAGENG